MSARVPPTALRAIRIPHLDSGIFSGMSFWISRTVLVPFALHSIIVTVADIISLSGQSMLPQVLPVNGLLIRFSAK